jgi:HEPN domain-containing protein
MREGVSNWWKQVITRYPDAVHGLPYELYDEEISMERLELAEKVIKWVKKELER